MIMAAGAHLTRRWLCFDIDVVVVAVRMLSESPACHCIALASNLSCCQFDYVNCPGTEQQQRRRTVDDGILLLLLPEEI